MLSKLKKKIPAFAGMTMILVLASSVHAVETMPALTPSHALSLFGDVKYPAGFRHFDYVNPDAPKGGVFSHVGATRVFNQNFLTFNSLNSFILKGDGAQGMQLTFTS